MQNDADYGNHESIDSTGIEPDHGPERTPATASVSLHIEAVKRAILDILSSLLLGLGLVYLASPFLLWWWIHGAYERYVWIIGGPRPYDSFGGGPFQLVRDSTLFLTGLSFTVVALVMRAVLRRIG